MFIMNRLCLDLHSLCESLLHLLITWIRLSCQSPHYLNMLSCCALSNFASIGPYRVIVLLLWEFSTSNLAEGFPLGFEWHQVSSRLPDSFKYCNYRHFLVVRFFLFRKNLSFRFFSVLLFGLPGRPVSPHNLHLRFCCIFITIFYNPCEFLTQALADGLSLESQWQVTWLSQEF